MSLTTLSEVEKTISNLKRGKVAGRNIFKDGGSVFEGRWTDILPNV